MFSWIMSFWCKLRYFGYSEETKEVLRKCDEISAEWRAMTRKLEDHQKQMEELARNSG